MAPIEDALARIQSWDERWCLRANRALRHAPVEHALRAISRLGDGILWYALMLAMLALDPIRDAVTVLHMIAVGTVCTVLYRALKQGTVRPRPYQVLAAIQPGAHALDRFSFPSGHTLHAVALAMVATAYHPALVWVLAPFAALTAVSRTVLGLHYPSDVLAGAVIGASVATASLRLVA